MRLHVGQFNERIEALAEADQKERYQQLADAALRHYGLGHVTPHFIRYNGGVAFRLVDAQSHPLYLLKIAESAGESGGIPPERMELVMEWLNTLAESGEIVVQEPVPSRDGNLVVEVHFPDLDDPFYVTVQRWVEGRHIRGGFSAEEAYRIGAMIATLHELSSRWTPSGVGVSESYNVAWLFRCLTTLSRVVTAGILSPEEWQTIEAGIEQVAKTMRLLRTDPDIWGPFTATFTMRTYSSRGSAFSPPTSVTSSSATSPTISASSSITSCTSTTLQSGKQFGTDISPCDPSPMYHSGLRPSCARQRSVISPSRLRLRVNVRRSTSHVTSGSSRGCSAGT